MGDLGTCWKTTVPRPKHVMARCYFVQAWFYLSDDERKPLGTQRAKAGRGGARKGGGVAGGGEYKRKS